LEKYQFVFLIHDCLLVLMKYFHEINEIIVQANAFVFEKDILLKIIEYIFTDILKRLELQKLDKNGVDVEYEKKNKKCKVEIYN
jgi:hypothetical protein